MTVVCVTQGDLPGAESGVHARRRAEEPTR
jgi:hypothetical protein